MPFSTISFRITNAYHFYTQTHLWESLNYYVMNIKVRFFYSSSFTFWFYYYSKNIFIILFSKFNLKSLSKKKNYTQYFRICKILWYLAIFWWDFCTPVRLFEVNDFEIDSKDIIDQFRFLKCQTTFTQSQIFLSFRVCVCVNNI